MFCNDTFLCSKGMILPTAVEANWPIPLRAFLHLFTLLYCFLGIAIISDVFMCAIERITSSTVTVRVPSKGGRDSKPQYKQVSLWNPTVANLSLMALGTSAPEILVALTEVIGNNFGAGDLGPGTVVGSAAYNLMMISAVCIVALPKNQTKRVEKFSVFCLTSFWNIFAYIWLLIILLGFSKNEVEVWEGAVTILFFFLSIISAYALDKYDLGKCFKSVVRKITITQGHELSSVVTNTADKPSEWREIERQVAIEHSDLNEDELAKMVALKIHADRPKDYLTHRIDAIRTISRSSSVIHDDFEAHYTGNFKIPNIEFSARVYCINPLTDRKVQLKIIRRGPKQNRIVFRYQTVNDGAKENIHFVNKSEQCIMDSEEVEKSVTINLIEGAEWKQNDMFTVKLEQDLENNEKLKIGKCSSAKVIYLGNKKNDSTDKISEDGSNELRLRKNCCEIEFAKLCVNVKLSQGFVRLPVIRKGNNYKPIVTVGYVAEGVNIQFGDGLSGNVTFEESQIETYFDIPIVGNLELEKQRTFLVRLINPSSNASLGETSVATVNNDGFVRMFNRLDTLVPKILPNLGPGKESWHEQFRRYLNVNGGDVKNSTTKDYLLHLVSFPWKAMCAFIPPPLYFGGGLTFAVSLALIAFITILIIDTAKTFGCLIGLDNTVTAITFVGVGSSLPDTFASKISAIQDKTADNAIGNVNGSNMVIVFLGLGLPWFIASVYWTSKGQKFIVPAGDTGFIVTIYLICAVITLCLLFARRYLKCFGKAELGGPTVAKWICCIILTVSWVLYVLLCSFEQYKYIPAGF